MLTATVWRGGRALEPKDCATGCLLGKCTEAVRVMEPAKSTHRGLCSPKCPILTLPWKLLQSGHWPLLGSYWGTHSVSAASAWEPRVDPRAVGVGARSSVLVPLPHCTGISGSEGGVNHRAPLHPFCKPMVWGKTPRIQGTLLTTLPWALAN